MHWALSAVTLVAVGGYLVFWCTANQGKNKGFGPYNTSCFLLLTVAAVTGVLATTGTIDGHNVTAIMTAIIGFAGGLFAGSKTRKNENEDDTTP